MVKDTLEVTNSQDSGLPFIDNKTNFLARGHLAPDAAFIYQIEADATYFYINVAPQYQSFNNQNWRSIETAPIEAHKVSEFGTLTISGSRDSEQVMLFISTVLDDEVFSNSLLELQFNLR